MIISSLFKKLAASSLAILVLYPYTNAQDTKGIKSANLRGSDLELLDNHDPQSELENFKLLDGYEANLFASEPMLANPVHMTWDSKGRLWVACSWTYPQLQPGEVADDKIIILEDTDNDGKADKSTVFADGLYLPTGIELANGGCYVGQSPDVYFLKDTDGDDVADFKELALTGFGIEDSHHSISGWKRGPGGILYFQEGIFMTTQVETQHGMVKNFNGGIYQYNTHTQKLDLFTKSISGNPWGHVFNKWGQSFVSNNPRIMHISPITGNSKQDVIIKDLARTSKQCGAGLATGVHVDQQLQGKLLTARFKDRAIARYDLIEDGAGFKANVMPPLIRSRHPNFRPVDVNTGPDGAIYIADWYNSIINHAQHDFRDPRRDHNHGRIWRITHKDRPLADKPKLVGEPLEKIIEQLKSPNAWTRHQARKEISEVNKDAVLKKTEAWVTTLDPSTPDYDHHLVEAMWACQNADRVSESILKKVITAKDGNARSTAARIIRYWYKDLSTPTAYLATLSGDSFPRTRMEAVLSAGFVPTAEAYAAALHCLDQPNDLLVTLALDQTDKALRKYWVPAIETGSLKFDNPEHAEFAKRKAGIGFNERLTKLIENKNPEQQEINEVCLQLKELGTAKEVKEIIKSLSAPGGVKSEVATAALLDCIQGLATETTIQQVRKKIVQLESLIGHENEEVSIATIRNLATWNATETKTALLKALKSAGSSNKQKTETAIAIATLAGKNNTTDLEELTMDYSNMARQYAAVAGLLTIDVKKGINFLTESLSKHPQEADPTELINLVLKNKQGTRLLTTKLKNTEIHPDVKSKVSAFHRVSGRLPKEIADYFSSSIKQENGLLLSEQLLAEDPNTLAAEVDKLGDPYRGELIYRRPALACINCHAIGSTGSHIGPNLAAIGSSASTGYMVESILKPNASIAEHYENRLFTLMDGTIQMGVITFKGDNELTIKDSAQGGKEIKIPLAQIKKEEIVPSLMPAGLANQLASKQEFLDLAKFVSLLGKPGDFANDERSILRKWYVVSKESTKSIPIDLIGSSIYSKVNGELLTSDISAIAKTAYMMSAIDIQVAGDIQVKLNSGQIAALWINGKSVANQSAAISVTKGKVVVTIEVITSTLNKPLEIEVATPKGSAAKFQVMNK